MPDISVIMPTYNRAHCLTRAVESCMCQTQPGVEVIIVDDGSTDNTSEIVAALIEQYGPERVRYIHQENAGACVARNRGIDEAHGKYIQFLDSDDYLGPEKFEVQVQALADSGRAIAVCDYEHVEEQGGTPSPSLTVTNDGDLHAKLAHGHDLSISTALIRADSIPRELRYSPELKRKQDVDFFFRYFMMVREYDHTPGVNFYYVQHAADRISNIPRKDTPVYDLFCRAFTFWQEHKERIPRENWWMLRPRGLHCARRLFHRGKRSRAREVVRKALAVPCGTCEVGGLIRIWIRTLTPDAVVNVLRLGLNRKAGPSDG